jgi:hypothetical protein
MDSVSFDGMTISPEKRCYTQDGVPEPVGEVVRHDSGTVERVGGGGYGLSQSMG